MPLLLKQFAFPFKLHSILNEFARSDKESIVSWQPHGKAFKIHKSKEFAEIAMPQYFNHTKYNSFRRQLQMYGFKWIKDKTSPDYACYVHPLFQRGKKELCIEMTRQKIKGTRKNSKKSNTKENNDSKIPMMPQPTQSDMLQEQTNGPTIRRVSLDEEILKAQLRTQLFGLAAIVERQQPRQFPIVQPDHDQVASNMQLRNVLMSVSPNEVVSSIPINHNLASVTVDHVPGDCHDEDESFFAGRRFFCVDVCINHW